MGREAGGGMGMGNTCRSMADSCQCWQKPLQYCKVISLQLIKINGKKKRKEKKVCSNVLISLTCKAFSSMDHVHNQVSVFVAVRQEVLIICFFNRG